MIFKKSEILNNYSFMSTGLQSRDFLMIFDKVWHRKSVALELNRRLITIELNQRLATIYPLKQRITIGLKNSLAIIRFLKRCSGEAIKKSCDSQEYWRCEKCNHVWLSCDTWWNRNIFEDFKYLCEFNFTWSFKSEKCVQWTPTVYFKRNSTLIWKEAKKN